MELNNCYFVSSLSRNILFFLCLMKDGYLFASENNGCVIFKNDMFMVFVFIVNGLFVLNFDGLSVCNVSVKRFRFNDLSFIYLWYCRLGYISEKRMKKFYSDGFLISFDFELYEICEVCLLGKMIKTFFTGFSERAVDLLEFVYSDVCGLMSTTVRGGF